MSASSPNPRPPPRSRGTRHENRHCYISAVDQERFGPIEFDWFHQEELPALLESRGAIFSDTDARVVRPLGFQLSDGRAYTYVPEGRTFSVQPGAHTAQTLVELSLDAWCAFAWELKTCFALLYADQLSVRRGGFGQMARCHVLNRPEVIPARTNSTRAGPATTAASAVFGDEPKLSCSIDDRST